MREAPPVSPKLTREKNRARSRAMAEAVISSFAATLKTEARKRGGFLTLPDLDELDVSFREKTAELTDVFEMAFNDAMREQEDLKWNQIKRPAFDRLMVKRFDHMLMVKDRDGVPHGTFPRRFLPGFFLALNMLLGPEAMENFHKRSDKIMTQVMKGIIPVDWELLDQNDEMKDIIIDGQLAIAWQFNDTQKRTKWFIQLVNANLAPVHEKATQVEANWEMDHIAFIRLINSLLHDLKIAVNDAQQWKHLKRRHPDAKRDEITAILQRLS
ncbi:MAG: hypothetical protein OEW37_03040 [Rhodospirillaceae bacterium]|nr:hypothetical protein [Rhodospirillaceae bacterium]